MHCVGSEGHKDENDVRDFKSLSGSSTGPEIFQIACRIQRKHRFRNCDYTGNPRWEHQRKRRGDMAPQMEISVTGYPPVQENELFVLHLHLHLLTKILWKY